MVRFSSDSRAGLYPPGEPARSAQGLPGAADPLCLVQALSSNLAFDFVRGLAAELSAGHVDLPSFPEIAAQVRRVLSDPKSSVEQVVRVVGSEPALAARLLRIANSASLNRSGRSVNDLRTAINRIGYNMVRSAAMSFSMNQLPSGQQTCGPDSLHERLVGAQHLRRGVSPSYLARNCSPRQSRMKRCWSGMMHGIGKLCMSIHAALQITRNCS